MNKNLCSYNNIEIHYKSRVFDMNQLFQELIATDDKGVVTFVNTYNKSQNHIKVSTNPLLFAQIIKLTYGCENIIAVSGEEVIVSFPNYVDISNNPRNRYARNKVS